MVVQQLHANPHCPTVASAILVSCSSYLCHDNSSDAVPASGGVSVNHDVVADHPEERGLFVIAPR
jgi:hypothetical protein